MSPSIRACGRKRRTATTWSNGPHLFDAAMALLGPGSRPFLRDYKFNVAPATDDRPHFFHFFKWRSLPELLSLKEQGGLPLLDWGYPVLVATLAQALRPACC